MELRNIYILVILGGIIAAFVVFQSIEGYVRHTDSQQGVPVVQENEHKTEAGK